MRARELLEDYNVSLESDLNNLLIAAKGNGLQQVKTSDIVDQLYGMGYSIDVNSIMPLLSNNPTVMNATPEMINMTAPEGAAQGGDTTAQDNADKVDDLATKTAKKGIEK
jgi:vacuolar-type H+-ATPase subunit C/Vma6